MTANPPKLNRPGPWSATPGIRREPSPGRALFVVMTTRDAAMAPTPPGSPPPGTGGRRGPYPRLRPGRSLFGGARARAPSARPPKAGSLASGGACRCAHDGQDSRLLREGSCAAMVRSFRRRRGGGSTPAVWSGSRRARALSCTHSIVPTGEGKRLRDNTGPKQSSLASARRLFTRRAAARMPRPIVRSPACQDARPRP